jgi:hypothetical protein
VGRYSDAGRIARASLRTFRSAETAFHTPSGPSGHLPRFAEKGTRGRRRSAFLDRLPKIEVVGEPKRIFSAFVHGISELPVRIAG